MFGTFVYVKRHVVGVKISGNYYDDFYMKAN
jgi:hypothetical protein